MTGGFESPPPSEPTIPRTRVHRVDSIRSYGEVPGTLAFEKRKADAQPDEMEIENPWVTSDDPIEPPRSVPITLVEEVHGGGDGTRTPVSHHVHHGSAVDAQPDLTTDRTLEDQRIEERIEEESGLHSKVLNAKLLQQQAQAPAATLGQSLTVPSSPEIKAVDEHDIATANAHTPELDLDCSFSPPQRVRSESLSAPRSPELTTVDRASITSANAHIPSDPRKPRSPRISISYETRPSVVETFDLHQPVDEGHLEAPLTPEIEKLDEFDIASTNVQDGKENARRPRSPSLKVTRAPNEASPVISPFQLGHDHTHLEAPLSPEVKGIDTHDISSANATSPTHSRPTSPSLVVTDFSLSSTSPVPELALPAPTIAVQAARPDSQDGIISETEHPAVDLTISSSPTPTTHRRRRSSAASARSLRSRASQQTLKSPRTPTTAMHLAAPDAQNDENNDDDDDDFDDFEEAGSDFGDFDDFEDAPLNDATNSFSPPPSAPPLQPSLPFPIPDFTSPTNSASIATLISLLIPPPPPSSPIPTPDLLTPRTSSFWSQLSAPPQTSPPQWKLSRVRRLFLVSLGVPIDLDEILPASTQKKLILSSISTTSSPSQGGAKTSLPPHLRKQTTTTTQPTSAPPSQTSHRTPTPPTYDLTTARALALTSPERLAGMSDWELRVHLEELRKAREGGDEVEGYWEGEVVKKREEKEAFEGVIESLVGWARRVRGGKR